MERLNEIGAWLKENGAAIYNTRTADIFEDGGNFFTKGKNGEMFVIVPLKEGDAMPTSISWRLNLPAKGSDVKLLMNGKKVKWVRNGDSVKVTLPSDVQKLKAYPAFAFSFKGEEKPGK